jgi:hypothetical protein
MSRIEGNEPMFLAFSMAGLPLATHEIMAPELTEQQVEAAIRGGAVIALVNTLASHVAAIDARLISEARKRARDSVLIKDAHQTLTQFRSGAPVELDEVIGRLSKLLLAADIIHEAVEHALTWVGNNPGEMVSSNGGRRRIFPTNHPSQPA